jgi:hypothetical protein
VASRNENKAFDGMPRRRRASSDGVKKRVYLRRGEGRDVEQRQPTASAASGAAVRARRGCDEEAPDPRGGAAQQS